MKDKKLFLLNWFDDRYSWANFIIVIIFSGGTTIAFYLSKDVRNLLKLPYFLPLITLSFCNITLFISTKIIKMQIKQGNLNKIRKIDLFTDYLAFYAPAILLISFSRDYANILWLMAISAFINMVISLHINIYSLALQIAAPTIALILHYIIWNSVGTKQFLLTDILVAFLATILIINFISLNYKKHTELMFLSQFELTQKFTNKYNLTKREHEILEYIIKGESTINIAKALYISKGTVKNHIISIFKKTMCHSRLELISKIILSP